MVKILRQNEELMVSPAILQRLGAEGGFEGGDGVYWAVVRRMNGVLVTLKSHALILAPTNFQRMFAFDMCRLLNGEIHHDGAWIVAFTHPEPPLLNPDRPVDGTHYGRWIFLWVDADGDDQFVVSHEDAFVFSFHSGPDYWIEIAEQAWQEWQRLSTAGLERREFEKIQYKANQGERPPSSA